MGRSTQIASRSPKSLEADAPVKHRASALRVQAKLEVGRADDPLEREADAVADGVLRAFSTTASADDSRRVRRASSSADRLGGEAVDSHTERAINSERGGGSPLAAHIASGVGEALGADLGRVRLHTGPRADGLARSLEAKAFTVGSDVFARSGERLETGSGPTHLLAHELAHVVQQGGAGRVKRKASVIRRNEESAELLTKLATPIAKAGPAIEAQKRIVDKLMSIELPDKTLVNLGAIALTKISDKDDELVQDAKKQGLWGEQLRDYGFIGRRAWDEVEATGVAGDVIENTLATMIDAQQIQYLRKAGLPNDEFMILVEVHFYLARDMDQWGFHKDTKGSTLFVNLNFHMDKEVVGPEFIVNPPSTPKHDEALGIKGDEATGDGTMPSEFLSDLLATRENLGEPDTIGNKNVPAYGYVAFVDEAIHHATPKYGHRAVKATHVKAYLEETYPAEAKSAQAGYLKWAKSFTGAGLWGFDSYLEKSTPIKKADQAKWLLWMKIANDYAAKGTYKRPDLLGAQMTGDEIDALLEFAGPLAIKEKEQQKLGRPDSDPGFFVEASVPQPGIESAIRSPLKKDKRPPLKREMSQKALNKQLPPPAETNRRFFRTWVRAVRIKK